MYELRRKPYEFKRKAQARDAAITYIMCSDPAWRLTKLIWHNGHGWVSEIIYNGIPMGYLTPKGKA